MPRWDSRRQSTRSVLKGRRRRAAPDRLHGLGLKVVKIPVLPREGRCRGSALCRRRPRSGRFPAIGGVEFGEIGLMRGGTRRSELRKTKLPNQTSEVGPGGGEFAGAHRARADVEIGQEIVADAQRQGFVRVESRIVLVLPFESRTRSSPCRTRRKARRPHRCPRPSLNDGRRADSRGDRGRDTLRRTGYRDGRCECSRGGRDREETENVFESNVESPR